ncbi:MAG: hypothetical protein NC483_04205 [Ruminococcus sp.]|nr:hypothetical protein [Ruminococcus sp.]
MRKILKNASLSIITIFLAFISIIDVNAASACEGLSSSRCRVGERGVIKAAGNGNVAEMTKSTSTKKTKEGYTKYSAVGVTHTIKGTKATNTAFSSYHDSYSAMFCLDAQRQGVAKLYAERFLLDKSLSKRIQTFDYAVMSVLTANGTILKSGTENMTEYWARLATIRALEYTFGFYNNEITYKGGEKAFYPNLTLVYEWNKENSSYYDALNKEVGLKELSAFSAHTDYTYTGTGVNRAKELYYTALSEATEFARNFTEGEKAEALETTAGDIDTSASMDGSEVFVQKDVVHKFKISGIAKENGSFVINGIKFQKDATYRGLTAYIKSIQIGSTSFDNKAQVDNILGKNLIEMGYDLSGETTIEITVHFEGWKKHPTLETLKCGQSPIKYFIDGAYSAENAGKFKDYIGTIWYSDDPEEQRYVGIEKVGEANDDSISLEEITKYETYLIDACSCTDLAEDCRQEATTTGNLNGQACTDLIEADCGECELLKIQCDVFHDQTACTKVDTVCDFTCETQVDTFECCEDNLLMVSEMDNKEVSILGPGPDNSKSDNIKACFVSKIDEQCKNNDNNCTNTKTVDEKDNSYALSKMNDNKYCTVSCKEDYKMTMPTARIVNAGRYFTFKAKVEGTKVCYTNTINREKYKEDIIAAQERMIKAYNNYQFWLAASKATPEASTGNCGSCSGTGAAITYNHHVNTTAPMITYNVRQTNGGYGDNISITNYNATQSVNVTSPVTNSCTGSQTCTCTPPPGGTCSNWTVSPTPETNDTLASLTSHISTELKNAEDEVGKAEDNYHNIINDFRKCTDDTWNSEMNYNPSVYYDYNEKDYMNKLVNKNDNMEEFSKTENNNKEDWYCVGENSIDNNYDSCSTGAKNSRQSTLATKQYIYCVKERCYIETDTNYNQISEASYVKRTSEVSATYRPKTLFYNVYPSGEITVNKADDNVEITNGLPVALGTQRGIYKYTVNIEKLGEFYDRDNGDNLGRYIGGGAKAVVDPAKLVYNCAYLVNIPKTDGWICDFDDTCTDDCISNCIGPNCPGYCDGDDCVSDCIGMGCIYDSGAGTSMVERTVSLNNLFPNGTTSYNWDAGVNRKANDTVDEIESLGNSVYDSEPILSITIDPSTARDIKIYNDKAEDENNNGGGGYSNSTMSCYKIGDYEEVACYSSFITELLGGTYGRNVVNDKSLIKQNGYRAVGDNNTGYFTLWNGQPSEDKMLGPSWK